MPHEKNPGCILLGFRIGWGAIGAVAGYALGNSAVRPDGILHNAAQTSELAQSVIQFAPAIIGGAVGFVTVPEAIGIFIDKMEIH